MDQGSWYLVAYDIADPRRLQRVHRCLSRTGIRVQRSVFLVFATPAGLVALLDEVEGLMHKREDDLRAYPISHPGELWFQGQRVIAGPLLRPGEPPAVSHPEPHSPGDHILSQPIFCLDNGEYFRSPGPRTIPSPRPSSWCD